MCQVPKCCHPPFLVSHGRIPHPCTCGSNISRQRFHPSWLSTSLAINLLIVTHPRWPSRPVLNRSGNMRQTPSQRNLIGKQLGTPNRITGCVGSSVVYRKYIPHRGTPPAVGHEEQGQGGKTWNAGWRANGQTTEAMAAHPSVSSRVSVHHRTHEKMALMASC